VADEPATAPSTFAAGSSETIATDVSKAEAAPAVPAEPEPITAESVAEVADAVAQPSAEEPLPPRLWPDRADAAPLAPDAAEVAEAHEEAASERLVVEDSPPSVDRRQLSYQDGVWEITPGGLQRPSQGDQS
jgi:hypothetical protein